MMEIGQKVNLPKPNQRKDLKLYVDMDGVVANMVKATLEGLNHGELYDYIVKRWPEGNDHFHLSETTGISKERIKRYLDFIDPWVKFEVLEHAHELIDSLERLVGPENIYFLTSPGHFDGAWTGKFLWIKKHFPKYAGRLIVTRHKDLMRGPAILIDDKFSTVEKVNALDPKYEYRAVLFPAFHNDLRGVNNPVSYTVNKVINLANQMGWKIIPF